MPAANGKHGNVHSLSSSHALEYVYRIRDSPGVFRARIFGEKVDFRDRHKMDMGYHGMTIVELRALARACGLRDYTGLRKAGLITFLQNLHNLLDPVKCFTML